MIKDVRDWRVNDTLKRAKKIDWKDVWKKMDIWINNIYTHTHIYIYIYIYIYILYHSIYR